MQIIYRNSRGAAFNLTGWALLAVARIDQKPAGDTGALQFPSSRFGIQAVIPVAGPAVMEVFLHEESAWGEVDRCVEAIRDAQAKGLELLVIQSSVSRPFAEVH